MTEFCVTGALPPPGMEWQIGKTATSMLYVKNTEAYLASLPQAKFSFDIEARHELLRTRIARVKSGELVLEWFSDTELFFTTRESAET